MVKKFYFLEIEKLKKKINFTAIKPLFFLKDVDTEKVSLSHKISFGETIINTLLVKCIMITVNPLHIILPKTCTYEKRYGRQTKWMNFG